MPMSPTHVTCAMMQGRIRNVRGQIVVGKPGDGSAGHRERVTVYGVKVSAYRIVTRAHWGKKPSMKRWRQETGVSCCKSCA